MRDGKYGPYVNFGKINATLPKGKDPMSVTLEEALALIAEKAAQGRRGGRKPSATAPRPAKKTSARQEARRQEAAAKRKA